MLGRAPSRGFFSIFGLTLDSGKAPYDTAKSNGDQPSNRVDFITYLLQKYAQKIEEKKYLLELSQNGKAIWNISNNIKQIKAEG